jgi:hypothetical protein
VAISNFTVNPADEIYCEVWIADSYGYLDPNGGYANFYFGDFTTGQSTSFFEPITPGSFIGDTAEWLMSRSDAPFGSGNFYDLSDYWYAVMTGAYAGDGNGNYVNYQGQGGIGIGSFGSIEQLIMFNPYGNDDILSTAYQYNIDTIEFRWVNFH